MKLTSKSRYFHTVLFVLFTVVTFGQSNKFKVVLDAGHGGTDWGASYHGFVEKKIALDVTLKVGKLLEKNPNIEVIYTRNNDTFVELNERANIANKNKASIFVSIHCNANKNTAAEGYETYVMGTHRTADNLEVAKAENNVVTMEKDYKVKYAGYDPKSPESAIGITIMSEEYMDNSISLASKVQNNMVTNFGRKDRRVKQAGFLVLREIYMPRILIEMGFISNKREGGYLNSEEGQNEVATGIAKAIVSYKEEYYGSGKNEPEIEKYVPKPAESTPVTKTPETKPTQETPSAETGVVFKVQIAASGKKLDLNPSNFKGLDKLSMATDNGTLYKYMYGNASDYATAQKNLSEAKAKGFESAYIVAFRDGKRMDLQEAIKK